MQTYAPAPRKFLRLPEVEACIGWKRSSIYQAVKEGRFPKQVKLGPKAVAWDAQEIASWQASKLAERDEKALH